MIHSSGLTAGSWKMSGGGTFGKSKTKVWFDIDCENSSKLLYEIQVDFSPQTNRDPQWVLVYLWWMKKVQFSPGFPSVHRKLRWKEDARCTSWLLLRKSPTASPCKKNMSFPLSLLYEHNGMCLIPIFKTPCSNIPWELSGKNSRLSFQKGVPQASWGFNPTLRRWT